MASGMFVPQLVTPVDTSFLAKIGNTIGTLKQDSEIAAIVKGIDPYDPNSKQRVINDLRAHSREGRDMADRMEGLDIRRQTATQQGEYQQGQLGVARDRLGLEQQRFGLEQEDTKAFREGLAKYGRGGGLAGIPSAAPAPPAPTARPAVAAEDEDDDDWKDATPEEGGRVRAPATRAAPIIQAPAAAAVRPVVGGFATQPAPGVRAVGGLLATTAAPTAPVPAAPLPAPPPAPVGGTAGTGTAGVPEPQRILPALVAGAAYAANRGAPAAPATPAAAGAPAPATAGAAAEPVETEGDLLGAEELPAPGTSQPRAAPDYTPRQLELRRANRELGNLMDYAKTPGRQRALQTHIDENNAEFAEIEAARTRGDAERAAARKAVTGLAAKDRSKLLMELGKKTQDNVNLRDNLIGLRRTANSPNYAGGIGGAGRAAIGSLGIEVNKMLKEYTGVGLDERLGPDAYNRWIQDPVARRRTAESLINALTLRTTGGSFGHNISNADRETIARINASLSDDPETINRIVDMHLALIDREDRMFKIAVQGEKKGRTAAQIQARLSRYGRENPLFQDADGKPTELGRKIDPSGARDYDAAQKAAREKDTEVRERYRDPGAGEAAVIGDRPPKPVEGLYPFPRNVYPKGANPISAVTDAAAEAVRPALEGAQTGAREFLRGDNPATRFFRGPGRMGYGAEGVPGAAVPAPQRAGEGLDIEQDFGLPSIGGIVNQGTRLAPGGIPWEAYRRSTNIERRSEPNEVPMPLAQQQMAAFDWMRDAEGQPVGPLSRAAGLADLEARAYARPGGAVQIPAALPLPPLPRRRPRREEKR